MPEYRVEVAPSARAMCQDTRCKQERIKIAKGELRFGTWVEPRPDQGSWKWKHWGCVSGLQMQQANELCDQNEDGELKFDLLDGYDELEEDHSDLQEKVRRCVAQSHIDPEDFKGDPDYNYPGTRGIRAPARKAKKTDDDAPDDAAAKTKASAKKGKRTQKKADDSEAEDAKPVKKAAKRKAEAKDGDADEDSKPAKKTKKSAKKVKAESDDEDGVEDQKPAKSATSKVTKKGATSSTKAKLHKRAKSSPDPEDVKHESEAGSGDGEEEPAPAAKKKAARGKAAKPAKAKAEPSAGRRRSQRMSAKD